MFKSKGKKIVLVGGCFDVLHPGHIVFLQKARQAGDKLIVLLESDEKIKKLKGSKRPVHTQKEREVILKALKMVDLVIPLPYLKEDLEYEVFIKKIKPDIIAATLGSLDNHHKERIAKATGAKLKYVTKIIGDYSTTNILTNR